MPVTVRHRPPPGIPSVAHAIPQTDQNNRDKLPPIEYQEYPKMLKQRDKDGKPTNKPYVDESNQIVIVHSEDEEAEFMVEHPDACASTEPVTMSAEDHAAREKRAADLEAENAALRAKLDEQQGENRKPEAPKRSTPKPNALSRAVSAKPAAQDSQDSEEQTDDATENEQEPVPRAAAPGQKKITPMLKPSGMPKNL